ncbi:HflK protein [Insulibacter thermoxylanivorax]|uniref:Protein HflK n=1 Tax=Insulibacter thermoxylanivorax TaxID=2749268 RepID=A0A916QAR8_9BACL|nr:FtsH protease activity modulator HflK [Insulibacter thermoxylanivorax]GFR37230.1 HflK protein [Insulibacter thermoxylanivorax]
MDMDSRQRPDLPQLSPKMIKYIIIAAIALLLLLWGSTMFYTVEEHEKAAVLTFGKYTKTVEEAGLHFKLPSPIEEVVLVPAKIVQRMEIGYREERGQTIIVEDEAYMITGDENIVSADAVVEWQITDVKKYLFNIDNAEQFLRNTAVGAIRSIIGSTQLDFAITEGKAVIQQQAKELLIDTLSKYETGIFVVDLKFQDIEPPPGEVASAFAQVTNAREEKNTKINEANEYRNERIPKARGEAQALIEKAEAQKQSRILNAMGDVAQFNAIYVEYANNPAVTRERLVLETLEKILPNAKIFITDSSGNTVNYLPLNELMRNSRTGGNNN